MATQPADGRKARSATPLTPASVTSTAVDAAEEAVQENVTALHLPVVGDVSLPPADHLVWYAGVAALTAMELIEWPVALMLTVGKALADNRSHRTLRSLGEALEDAG
ncbi:MAG: hypothetical protein M3137_06945 [Actinomycetota bacterium]|nr:hypothetical protein [Actinomycetota bacterium]